MFMWVVEKCVEWMVRGGCSVVEMWDDVLFTYMYFWRMCQLEKSRTWDDGQGCIEESLYRCKVCDLIRVWNLWTSFEQGFAIENPRRIRESRLSIYQAMTFRRSDFWVSAYFQNAWRCVAALKCVRVLEAWLEECRHWEYNFREFVTISSHVCQVPKVNI